METFLKNAWYAAAFSDEVSEDPFPRTLLGQPMVIYRMSDGRPAMLMDRCPHRFAPLSRGKVRGDSLECPYHGLTFDASGACIHNPHKKGGGSLKAAQTLAYPLMEKYGFIWFWPGDPARIDVEALPRITFLEQPEKFSTVKNRLHVKGNYQLIIDNLLDLSHAAYIHPQFAGAPLPPEQLLSATSQRLERGPRSITNHRIRTGLPAPKPSRVLFGYRDDQLVTSRTTMTWHPPAILDFPAGVWAADEDEADGAHIPQLHVITPETEFSSHYFFINGRNRRLDDSDVDAALLEMFEVAFHHQDEPMIEAVQERMGRVTDINLLNPVLLQTDAAPVAARRMLARMIADEQGKSRETEEVTAQ
jgi:vanillate O-demethylase monooxygenase subunit